MGDPRCPWKYGMKCCAAAQLQWVRRAATQKCDDFTTDDVIKWLEKADAKHIALYDRGGSGRLLCEIGAASPASKRLDCRFLEDPCLCNTQTPL